MITNLKIWFVRIYKVWDWLASRPSAGRTARRDNVGERGRRKQRDVYDHSSFNRGLTALDETLHSSERAEKLQLYQKRVLAEVSSIRLAPSMTEYIGAGANSTGKFVCSAISSARPGSSATPPVKQI